MHQEPAGADGLQALKRLGYPIDVGKDFAADGGFDPDGGHDGAQTVLDPVDLVGGIERDLLDAVGLVEIEDRQRQPVVLESRFQRR